MVAAGSGRGGGGGGGGGSGAAGRAPPALPAVRSWLRPPLAARFHDGSRFGCSGSGPRRRFRQCGRFRRDCRGRRCTFGKRTGRHVDAGTHPGRRNHVEVAADGFDGGAERSSRRRIGQASATGFDDSVEHDLGRGVGELRCVLRHLIGLVLELRRRIGGCRVDQVLDEDERVQFGSDRRRHQRPAADGADDRSEERRRGGESGPIAPKVKMASAPRMTRIAVQNPAMDPRSVVRPVAMSAEDFSRLPRGSAPTARG